MEKTSSGLHIPISLSFEYMPVCGDRKSGIPALTLIPAPHKQIILFALPCCIYSATPSTSKLDRIGSRP